MGIGWSTRQDFYIHHYENPRIQRIEKEFLIRMIPISNNEDSHVVLVPADKKENPFATLVSRSATMSEQCAMVLSIRLTRMVNEFPFNIRFELHRMFDPNPNADATSRLEATPDDTGNICIFCPANRTISVKTQDQTVYRTRLESSEAIQYAGLDRILYEPAQSGDTQCFNDTDPLIAFVLSRGWALEQAEGDVQRKTTTDGKVYYLLRTAFANRVREFLKNAVFDQMRYTRFENCKIICKGSDINKDFKMENQSLLLVFTMEYILISGGTTQMIHTEQKLE